MTTLPYNLGGSDDPHFQIDAGGNFIPDRRDANEERYAPAPDELRDYWINDTSGFVGAEHE